MVRTSGLSLFLLKSINWLGYRMSRHSHGPLQRSGRKYAFLDDKERILSYNRSR